MQIKTIFLLFLLLISLFSFFGVEKTNAVAVNSWTIKEPMQKARGRLGVAVVDRKIYAIGGDSGYFFGQSPNTYSFLGTFQYESVNEQYDPELDEWTFKAPMPTPRYHFAVAVYQNKIYCIGGLTSCGNSSSVETGITEVYDPATDTWETKMSMPTSRLRLDANVVNGKIYVIGGHTFNNYTTMNLCEVYDPDTDSWTTKTVSPPYGIRTEASAVNGDRIYFLGTEKSPLPPYIDSFLEIYSPENDNWTVCGPAPIYDSKAVVGVTTGVFAPNRMHILFEDAHHVYDPETNNWTPSSSMIISRSYAGIAIIDDILYVIGGIILPQSDALIGELSPSNAIEQHIPHDYIPEFSSWIVFLLFLTISLVIIIYPKKLSKTQLGNGENPHFQKLACLDSSKTNLIF